MPKTSEAREARDMPTPRAVRHSTRRGASKGVFLLGRTHITITVRKYRFEPAHGAPSLPPVSYNVGRFVQSLIS